MKKSNKQIQRITRNHRGKTPLNKIHSVEDLLTCDDINELLRDCDNLKTDIKNIIVIYRKRDGHFGYSSAPKTKRSLLLYMLELAKVDVLNGDDNDDYDNEDEDDDDSDAKSL